MKFFTALAFSGLVALVAAIPQSSSTTDVASSTSTAPLSPTASCIAACQNDINCQAGCVGVPAPNASMVNSTTECAAKCPQGSGSPADTEAYAKCQQGCISSLFFSATGTAASGAAETGASSATGNTEASTTDSSSGSSQTGSSSGGTATSGSGSSSSSTASGSAASTSHTGAASSNIQMGASAAGLMGIMLAALAL